MNLGEKLIVAGVVLVPAAFSMFCACVAIYDYATFVPSSGLSYQPEVGVAAFLSLAGLVVAVALGLITSGVILMRKKRAG